MTTQQLDRAQRPLDEIDEVVERMHDAEIDRQEDVLQSVRRALADPRWVAVLVVGFVSILLVAVLASTRRPPPRSTEDIILERSREAFERSVDALEAAMGRLGSAFDH